MNRLRVAAVACLMTLVVLITPSMANATSQSTADLAYSPSSQIGVTEFGEFKALPGYLAPQQTDPGPSINPEDKEKADKQMAQNKIIAGVLAAVLLGSVIWGRHVRKKRNSAG